VSEREIRKIQNSNRSLETDSIITRDSPNGITNFTLSNNKQLAMVRKQRGKLWKTYLSADGNQYVDRILTTRTLKYTHKFVDYRTFIHNFSDDISTSTHYIPWQGTGEQSSMDESTTAYLTPFNMTCYKILFRPETLSTATADFTFTLQKQDDGDTTRDTVATFTYTTTLASNTLITINETDWNNSPAVGAGDKVGISIAADVDPAGSIDWYITSVWRIDVII